MSAVQTPTVFEQELLELINRARLAPVAEFDALITDAAAGTSVQANITDALAYFGVDLDSFRAQLTGKQATAALAWNGSLASVADGHSQYMIDTDTQSHRLPGEMALDDRVTAAGYDTWIHLSENVFAYAQDAVYAHAGFFIDWGYDSSDISGGALKANWQSLGDGIQDPAGHRNAILDAGATEIGISAIEENDPDTEVGTWVITQNFGNRSDYRAQLLGVVIDDTDHDRFYDQGEGMSGVTVVASGAAGTFVTTTWNAGGYQMVLPGGAYKVTAYGGGLDGIVQYDVVMGSTNLKLDFRAQDTRPPSEGITGSAGDDALQAIPGLWPLSGGNGADTLTGSAGEDWLAGDNAPLAMLLPEAAAAIGAQVFRLYGATLGRAPDADGYLNWTMRLYSGDQSLVDVARGFVGSREFQQAYGALDDRGFVSLLYNNVLNRDPDVQGLQNWLEKLDDGRSRADVVLGLSESVEFTRQTASAAAGFADAVDPASWSDDVYRLYRATLDRAPDAAGFGAWTDALAGGRDLGTVASRFVESTEFQRFYGALDDADFVSLLYNNVLGRDPDAQGLQNWLDYLDGGRSRAEVVLGFSQSAEFAAATAPALKDFMQGLGGGDVLNGGGGNDLLAGGRYADTFVFAPGDGSDRVMDFEPWDMVDLTGFGYVSEAEAQRHFSQSGADVVFSDGAASVLFEGVDLNAVANWTILI